MGRNPTAVDSSRTSIVGNFNSQNERTQNTDHVPKRHSNALEGLRNFFQSIKNLFFPSAEVKAEREHKRAEATFEKSAKALLGQLVDNRATSSGVSCCNALIRAHETLSKKDPIAFQERFVDVLSEQPERTRKLIKESVDLKFLENLLKQSAATSLTRKHDLNDTLASINPGIEVSGEKHTSPEQLPNVRSKQVSDAETRIGMVISTIRQWAS